MNACMPDLNTDYLIIGLIFPGEKKKPTRTQNSVKGTTSLRFSFFTIIHDHQTSHIDRIKHYGTSALMSTYIVT